MFCCRDTAAWEVILKTSHGRSRGSGHGLEPTHTPQQHRLGCDSVQQGTMSHISAQMANLWCGGLSVATGLCLLAIQTFWGLRPVWLTASPQSHAEGSTLQQPCVSHDWRELGLVDSSPYLELIRTPETYVALCNSDDRLCGGLVATGPGCRPGGSGFDCRRFHISPGKEVGARSKQQAGMLRVAFPVTSCEVILAACLHVVHEGSGPAQPGALSLGQSGWGVKLTIHIQVVPWSRKCGSIHPLPPDVSITYSLVS
jgi:hypothetical protein